MKFTVVLILAVLALPSLANPLRTDTSLTLLYGSQYQVGDATRTVFTLEHSSGFTWGDNYFFLDRMFGENGNHSTYFELAPRFSISDYQNQWIKGIKIATTWESGKHFDHRLIGLGTNLKAKGFVYVGLNFYRRLNDNRPNTWQTTLNWRKKFQFNQWDWVYDGFIDWASASAVQASSFNFTSQLKINLAQHLGLSKPIYLGSEIVIWNNKFGINNVNERNLNLLFKAHF
ncbi:DUF5020 family protein [Paraglaciecola aestuariivivens]